MKVDSLQVGRASFKSLSRSGVTWLVGFIMYYLAHKETRELAESLLRLD